MASTSRNDSLFFIPEDYGSIRQCTAEFLPGMRFPGTPGTQLAQKASSFGREPSIDLDGYGSREMRFNHALRSLVTRVQTAPIRETLIHLRAVDFRVAFVTLCVATLGTCFFAIADETMEGDTLRIDNAVLLALRESGDKSIPIGPPALLGSMSDISALGGLSVISIMLLAISGYFALTRKFRLMVYLFFSVGGGALLMLVLKQFFGRSRPDVVPHLQEISQASFPSGHSMVAAIVYLTLAAMLARTTTKYRVKIYFVSIAILLSVLIGISRVYLGVHYPTDVVAGWCAGAAWAALTYLIADWLDARGKIEREDAV